MGLWFSINGVFVKFLTENDEISGRHSLVIQCNTIATLDGEVDAIWDRGRIIDFVIKFVDNPKEYQKKDGLHPLTAVATKVRSVRKDNDPLVEFLEEHYELTNNNEDYVLFADMLEPYKRNVKNWLSRPKLSEAAKRFGVTRMGDHFGRTPTYRGSKGWACIRLQK
ncbi:hypothetical protein BDK51DRAFT_28949 [Blyttiomyces helicus]|uniref:Uncharacterized protein n=1 Tax=Blyttiomyces helicus TaxID=388810 RepID=A0A4P9WMR9_9FUNG|nr:hypothetical protein BDK51DRAFT_28949 [Blyttiomyces helicus]|eukprot:RKO94381.1 hypothetical protein BDK51DRAFT_28949 [Blyttiomyces helicus]